MVQAGFVRIASNPVFSPRAVSPKEALDVLASNTRHPAHQFWPDHMSLADGLVNLQRRIVGREQLTDAYLHAPAIYHRDRLASLDKGLLGLLKASN